MDDEATPLLKSPSESTSNHETFHSDLPKAQLLTVYTIKLSIPTISFSTLPYLNSMVARSIHKPRNDVGYYSGWVFTAATFAHIITVYLWATLSDWVGRIPIVVLGLTGLSISTFLFGTATTFPAILSIRFIVGAFSGIVPVLHSIVGELVSSTAGWSTAFPLYDIMAALGFILGPAIGGALAPSEEEEETEKYPFLKPCAAVALLAAGSAALAAFCLRETRTRKGSHSEESEEERGERETEQVQAKEVHLKAKELLAIPSIRAICLTSTAVGMFGSSFNHCISLVAYTQLELSTQQIATALSFTGLLSILLKLSLPLILRKRTSKQVLQTALNAWIPTFLFMGLLPFIKLHFPALLYPVLALVLFLSRVGCLAFSLKLILIREHTPETSALGASNGLSELAENLGAIVGPGPLSALYSYSVKNNALGGYLWTIVAVAVSTLSRGLANGIIDKEKEE